MNKSDRLSQAAFMLMIELTAIFTRFLANYPAGIPKGTSIALTAAVMALSDAQRKLEMKPRNQRAKEAEV